MNGRERVQAAIHYRAPDHVPLQYYYSPVGYYEHGEKLNDLYAKLPGDFEPFYRMPVSGPTPNEIDEAGRYHGFYTDEWGVVWEKRIFGVTGIPCAHPLSDASLVSRYTPPVPVVPGGPGFPETKSWLDRLSNDGYYAMVGCCGIYERLIALCGEENALCGIASDDPDICRIADLIMEYGRMNAETAVACGADGIAIGDDYGTETGLLLGYRNWKRFIYPRLKYIMRPAAEKGLNIHFHSCGQVSEILEDLKTLGVNSIWPQLPAYNMETLAARCRELRLAVAIHTDRARVMTFGTPREVRDLVNREYDVFRMRDGGAWFYVEADNGFPYENIEALIETIAQWR